MKWFLYAIVIVFLIAVISGCAKSKAKQLHDSIQDELDNEIYFYEYQAERIA